MICLFFSIGVSAQKEVIYEVFQRSFFDSNGDGHGDFKGIQQKLDYLQRLGVNTILLAPVYQSDFYDNYFATDFEKIDPKYGAFTYYRDLVQEVHRRKMKVYLDVQVQYVSAKHPWVTEASKYKGYLVYTDRENKKPYYYKKAPELTLYDGSKGQAVAVNLKDEKVKEYFNKMFKYWMDPNADGKFYEGVDGFRISNMADKLEDSGKLTNLFKDFWAPLLAELKKINAEVKIMAGQDNHTSFGNEYYTKAHIDGVSAFRLQQAIQSFDKKKIETAADSTFNYLPQGRQPVVFIESHDAKRFATIAGGNMAKMKAGAALNVLMGGTPLVYYGQEIGMKGEPAKDAGDGTYIPVREAFEWYAGETGQGMALWYKDSGPWWDNRNMKSNDGVSFEEQDKDKASLWSFYQDLMRLRVVQPTLATGKYKAVPNQDEKVVSFIREEGTDKILVVVNLSEERREAYIDPTMTLNFENLKLLIGSPESNFQRGGRTTVLKPYGVQVWKIL